MIAPRRPRLTPDDWLAAGQEALAEAGPAALGAEPLARRLGTTKGSFYWHFEDVPAYSARLLARWQETALGALAPTAPANEPTLPAAARLRALAQAIAAPPPVEPALRAWAASDPQAAAALRRVDDARIAALAAGLSECGLANPDMARILYGAAIGMQALSDRAAAESAIGTLVDLMLALG